MAKRKKWKITKIKVMPVAIRDSEFIETLADLGRIIYDEINSLPDSNKSIDRSSHNQSVTPSASFKHKGWLAK